MFLLVYNGIKIKKAVIAFYIDSRFKDVFISIYSILNINTPHIGKLLDTGLLVNTKNKYGMTPLDVAYKYSNGQFDEIQDVVEVLRQAGGVSGTELRGAGAVCALS